MSKKNLDIKGECLQINDNQQVNINAKKTKQPIHLAVTGGKGGTGKSTVAILLAFKFLKNGKRVLLVDTDVECPNDYLLLNIDQLTDPVSETHNFYPKIDSQKCQKCGLCVEKCTANALFQVEGQAPALNKYLCSSCGVCWTICPHGAIHKDKFKNGDIYVNEISENFTLLTGRSLPGIRETSPVVDDTKAYVSEHYLSKDSQRFDVIIIDTAAGTHCSVISALENVQQVVAVTEPTPLGDHDLKVILDVAKVMDLKSHIIVNQYDVGDLSLIEKTSQKKSVPLIGGVRYSKKLARFYSKGQFWQHKELADLLEINLLCDQNE